MSCVAGQVGLTDHLALVIDVGRNVAARAAKVAEVNHSTVWALWPEHSTNNISSYATARADRLALVVDCVRERVRVAGKRRELLDLAFFPDRSLNLQKEERARVWRGSLCSPHYLTLAVYPEGLAVVTAKQRQGCHQTLLPNERETDKKVPVTANVLSIRIWSGSLGVARNLATSVDRDTYADQPSESAEVSNCAFLPKKRIRGRVPGYRRDTAHRGSIVKSIGR